MSDIWNTPPTEDELRAAGVWDSPPTEDELRAAGVWDSPPTEDELAAAGVSSAPVEQDTADGPVPGALTPALDATPIDGMRLVPLVPDEDDEARKDAYVRTLFEAGLTKAPDRMAGIIQLAESSRAPVDMVEQRFDEFKRSAEASNFDARSWRLNNPDLYDILVEKPHLAPVVIKDQVVSSFSKAMRTLERYHVFDHLQQTIAYSPLGPLLGIFPKHGKDFLRMYGPPEPEEPAKQVAYQESPLRDASAWEIGWDVFGRRRRMSELAALGSRQLALDSALATMEALGGDADSVRSASFENEKEIVRLEQELGATPDYGQGEFGQLWIEVVESLASQVDSFQGLGAGAILGAAAGAAATRSVVGAKAGMRVGVKVGGFLATFNQEAGSAYLQFRRALDDDGNRVDREVAIGAAALYGAMAAGVEVLTIVPTLRAFGPIGEAVAEGRGAAFMRSALTDATKVGALREIGKRWLVSSAAEGGEEGLQSFLQSLAEYGAKSVSAGELQHFDADAIFADSRAAAETGFVGSALGLGAAQVSVSIAQEAVRMESSRRGAARVAEITKLAASDVARAAPKEVARLIEAETARSGQRVTHLYIDPKRLVEAVQSEGGQVDEAARELMGPEGPERLRNALLEATDLPGGRATLEVPVQEFLEQWGAKPIAQSIVQDMATRPGHFTAREETLFQSSVQALADQLLAQAEDMEVADGGQIDPELGAGVQEKAFIKAVEKQLVATGRMGRGEVRKSVALMRAFVKTMAQRMGKSAEEQFQYWRMTVEKDLSQSTPGPASLGAIRDAFDALPEDMRLRAYHLDRNTGLLNARGDDARQLDPSRPFRARFSVEGFKFTNDKFGHEAADGALRLMANVLRGHGYVDGAKRGGDIEVDVATEADAQALAKAMEAAIDPEGRIRVIAATAPRAETYKQTSEALGEAAKAIKDAMVARGELGHRKGAPRRLLPSDAPSIALEEGMEGVAPDSIEAKVAFAHAAEALRPIVDTYRGARRVEDTPLSDAHREAYAREQDAFRAIAIDESGLLSDDGFAMAREVNPKAFVMSADLRAFKEMNEAFGRQGTDAIKQFFGEVLHELGAGQLDTAHLHGDEYAAQADSQEALREFYEAVKQETDRVVFVFRHEDGSYTLQKGLSFAYGIGKTFDEADRERLPEAKREQDERGVSKPIILKDVDAYREAKDSLRGHSEGANLRWVDVQDLVDRRREAQASRARGERLNQKVRLLTRLQRHELRKRAKSISSPESKALVATHVARTGRLLPAAPRVPGFRSKKRAFENLVWYSYESRGELSPSSSEDQRYWKWKHGRGETKPRPFGTDLFRKVNQELGLTGDDRISSLAHAFDLLTAKYRARTWETIEPIVEWLNGNVDGLKLRMPDEYLELKTRQVAEEEMREREHEFWQQVEAGAVRDTEVDASEEGTKDSIVDEGAEVDTSFDFGFGDEEITDETLEQPSDDDVRGWVNITKKGMHRAFRIFLTEQSDLSTFLHESAHVYFEMLGDLAEHPSATQQVKDDYATVLAWLGVSSRSELEGLDPKLRAEAKEKFAVGFEAFLMAGETPSVSLAETFHTFRLWLSDIYKTLDSLNVELDKDVREVFARMLATDAEIEAAQRAAGLDKPLWRSPAEAGMTPDEWVAYLKDRQKSMTSTAMRAHRAMAQARLRAAEAFRSAEFQKFKEKAEEEFDKRPDWRAWRYMRLGEYRTEDGRIEREPRLGMMDRDRLREIVGENSAIEKRLAGRLFVRSGQHPSEIANQFGFPSAKDMFAAIEAMPDRDATVQQRAEEMMRAERPEIDGEVARLAELAQAALHNEHTADWLLKEWAQIRRKARQDAPDAAQVPIESIKQAAKELVAKRKVGALDPGTTLNRERMSAEYAARAIAKGNMQAALLHKQQQLLHHFVWRELVEAKKDRDTFVKLLDDMGTERRRATLAKASPHNRIFLVVSDLILEGLGLKSPDMSIEVPDDPVFLLQGELGDLADVFPATLARKVINGVEDGVSSLTVAEARELRNGLAYLYREARNRTMILDGERKRDIERIIEDIDEEASLRPDLGPPDPEASGLRKMARGVWANLLEPAEAIRRLGPTAYRVLWSQGYIDAERREDELLRKVGKFFAEQWDKLPKELQARRYDLLTDLSAVPWREDIERRPVFDRQWMWMIALNMGNRSNRERLLGGYQWVEAEVLQWLDDNMTKEEWDFVESIWRLLDDELYPLVAKTYEDATGLPPPKIEPSVIKTRHGEIKGGYFPARYDPVASRVGERQARENLERTYHQKAGAISVARSFTKKRAEKYEDIVRLDWSVVPAHVASVVHYVAFDGWVRSTRALLTHPEFARVARHRLGDADYTNLIESDGGWLAMASSSEADALPRHLRDTYALLGLPKQLTVMGSIAWSVPTAAADLTNPLVAGFSGRVSMRFVLGAMLRAMNPLTFIESRRRAVELGHEPGHRADNIKRKVRWQLEQIGKGGRRSTTMRVIDAARVSAWAFMDMSDKLATTVIWDAAFEEAKSKGQSDTDAARSADDVVGASMPPQDIARQPAFLRDRRGVGQIVIFYGYFAKLQNMVRATMDESLAAWRTADDAKLKLDAAASVAWSAGRVLAMLAVAQLLGEFISGRGKEDDEEIEEWILRKMLAAPFMLLPFISGPAEYIANAAASHLVGDGSAATRRFNPRSSPIAAAGARVIELVGDIASDEGTPDEKIWDILALIGLGTLTPLISPQLHRTGKYITGGGAADDLSAGNIPGVVGGLIYGERDRQPSNPFRALE